jgi:ribulose-phosphate 3-epimerase
VFNPATPLHILDNVIEDLDLILIMSVNPGFGGQSFIHSSLDKITKVRKMIDESGKDIRLEVDGGINNETIGLASAAGADTFVAGSAIFNTDNYEQTISTLRSKIV